MIAMLNPLKMCDFGDDLWQPGWIPHWMGNVNLWLFFPMMDPYGSLKRLCLATYDRGDDVRIPWGEFSESVAVSNDFFRDKYLEICNSW